MNKTESFYKLTPHVVLDAVEQSGYEPMGVCSPMNSLENRVYRISLNQDKALVAKFYRPGRWTKDQIEEEHLFLWELEREELPVAAPLRFANGQSIGIIEGIYFSIWELKGGRQKDEFSPDELLSLGRIIGRIHHVGSNTEFSFRPEISTERYLMDPLSYFQQEELLDPVVSKRYEECLTKLRGLYEEKSSRIPYIRLHGDCHVGNILFRDESPLFLDFDDSLTGPAVQDLWMLTGGDDEWARKNRAWIMEGYLHFQDFDPRWWDLAELLRGLRLVYYVGWLARRRKDPAFSRFFNDFGTRDFWERETLELEQLLDKYQKTSHAIPSIPWE